MALVRTIALRVAGSLKDPRSNFVAGSILPAIAAVMFLTFTSETRGLPTGHLKASDSKTSKPEITRERKSSLLSRLDPRSFIRFFSASPQLSAIAAVLVLQEASWFCDPLSYRQNRLQWSMKDSENMLQVANICDVVRPAVYSRLAELYGLPTADAEVRLQSPTSSWEASKRALERTAVWDSRIGVLCTLNTTFGTRWSNILNPVLGSLAISGGPQKALALLSEAQDMGVGETLAAQSNLSFPLSLLLPSMYAESFVLSRKLGFAALPLLATAAIQLATSEMVVPWAFGKLAASDSPLSSQ